MADAADSLKNIPFLDLKTSHQELWPEIAPFYEQAFMNAAFIGGEHVNAFEKEFAAFCNANHCATVNSGTDALHLAFRALGIGAGDEVITTPHTFIATTEAISLAGATPVFTDINPKTYTIDPNLAEKAVTPRTKAIVPVHLYGQCADMDALMALAKRHNLVLVEDAAQAHGATFHGRKAGTMGHAAAFSFYPGKNLGACGEAGAVVSDDEQVIQRVRQLRDHGQAQKYYHDVEGVNARMDALQAIVLRAKLKRLGTWNDARARAAKYYDERLGECGQVTIPYRDPDNFHIYHLYVVLVENRDSVQEYLTRHGVGTGLHYPLPLHLQKAYARMGHQKGDFPVTEHVAERLLSLPMFPGITREQQDYVCDRLIEAVDQQMK
ncbi:MAG: DegT/DnrJ/EryC1/StrS family aminotransferase [Candidatus Sumerlaeota bacterium]|nr:DegT/DnrJ/EryC1/StrS family aminotransferase [Candidatus Sumerlaeota bacterium]